MIRLTELLTENDNKFKENLLEFTIPGKSVTSINMKPYPTENGIAFMAKSSKDLDAIYELTEDEVINHIQSYLDRKWKNIKFEVDNGYRGAGYNFKINLFDLAKKMK